ncbi:MAG TPA: methionine--tRNA ligase, partial [Alphaproteobacteria bacterium]|nr:methionine--tRNA ligase [Alphaproteobacteria bacterium]
MNNNFYITTPIYYPSGKPHLGHTYCTLVADSIARFNRLNGKKVMFATGTDEHGLKLQRKAEEMGITPAEYVASMREDFKTLSPLMNFSNDDFISTTEERHKKAAQAMWKRLEENGYIYKDTYAGWYCVSDEAYFTEEELVDGKSPDSGNPVEWMEEESYFFKLSAFTDKLLEFYEANPNFIQPETRKNEIVNFVKQELRDFSISRTKFDWGVSVPGDEKHVMYVWIDALTNYLTVAGFPGDISEFWPADMHLVGKDIAKFHCIYWPAMLMAADLPTPKTVFVHGHWLADGKKMSKSL